MKQVKILSAIFMAMFVCFFASSAFAQFEPVGFDARAGLAATYVKPDYDSSLSMAGLNVKLEFGYRWQYFGAYLAQDLGGAWPTETDDGVEKKGWFIGGTYVLFRGIFDFMDNMQVDLGLGIGMAYSDGKKDSDKAPIIVNKDGDGSVAFALKLAFSYNYFVTDMIGVGFFLDYNYIYKKVIDEAKIKMHQVNPGIQAVVKF